MVFRFRIEQFLQLAECWDVIFAVDNNSARVGTNRPAQAGDPRNAWDKANRKAKARSASGSDSNGREMIQ